MPCLILERKYARLVVAYSDLVAPGQKVLVRLKDPWDESDGPMVGYGNGYGRGYGDLLIVEPLS